MANTPSQFRRVTHQLTTLTLLVTLAALLLVACSGRDNGPGAPADTQELTDDAYLGDTILIATWNVERFFDTTCDSGNCSAGSFEALPGTVEFNAETERIANAITYLAADVVLLQEIETEVCFDALLSRVSDDYETAVFGETGSPGSVDVAILADGELIETVRHRDMTPLVRPDGSETTFARELLEVRVAVSDEARELDQPDVIVFATHFKSKANDDPGRRLAEARAAQEIVSASAALYPDALVVLGGDLNDTPGSEPLDALLEDGALARVNSDIPGGRDATFFLSGNGVAIDHILQATAASGRYVPRSSFVFRDGERMGFGGSDHGALRSQFVLP